MEIDHNGIDHHNTELSGAELLCIAVKQDPFYSLHCLDLCKFSGMLVNVEFFSYGGEMRLHVCCEDTL